MFQTKSSDYTFILYIEQVVHQQHRKTKQRANVQPLVKSHNRGLRWKKIMKQINLIIWERSKVLNGDINKRSRAI